MTERNVPLAKLQSKNWTNFKLKLRMELQDGVGWASLPPEVLDMIFQYLPAPALLSCGVVSKKWKKAARDVLKRSRVCYAHIKYFRHDLQTLNEMITSTNLMEMINGLHIRNEIRPAADSTGVSTRFMSRQEKDIFTQSVMPIGQQKYQSRKLKYQAILCSQWKYLNMDVTSRDLPFNNVLILNELISATADSLQKLVVGRDEDWKFMRVDKEFPKLKSVQNLGDQNSAHSKFILRKIAPNLEHIRCDDGP